MNRTTSYERHWLVLTNAVGQVSIPLDRVVSFESMVSAPCSPDLKTCVEMDTGRSIYVKESVNQINETIQTIVQCA